MAKAKVASWEVPDTFWERVEPPIPKRAPRQADRKYIRKPGGGGKPKDARWVFEDIVSVLRPGASGRRGWLNMTRWRASRNGGKASTEPW